MCQKYLAAACAGRSGPACRGSCVTIAAFGLQPHQTPPSNIRHRATAKSCVAILPLPWRAARATSSGVQAPRALQKVSLNRRHRCWQDTASRAPCLSLEAQRYHRSRRPWLRQRYSGPARPLRLQAIHRVARTAQSAPFAGVPCWTAVVDSSKRIDCTAGHQAMMVGREKRGTWLAGGRRDL